MGVQLNIPVDKLKSVNGLLRRIGTDMQKLLALDTAATATRKELDLIRNRLNSLAGNMDRLWENIRNRTSEDDDEFGFLAKDKQKVVRNTRLAVKDIDFSKRPLNSREIKAILNLERKLEKLKKQVETILREVPKVKRSIEKGIQELDRLRVDIDGATLRISFKHKVVGSEEEIELERVLSGSLFSKIAQEATSGRGLTASSGPEPLRILKSMAAELRTTGDLIQVIGKSLQGNAIGIEAIENQARSTLRDVNNSLDATATATKTNERTRQTVSNVLDALTVAGILGGVALTATTGGVAAAAALAVGFGARLVKTVLGLFRIVR